MLTEDLVKDKRVCTRFTIRVHPLECTFFSDMKDFKEAAQDRIADFFGKLPEGATWSCDIERRMKTDRMLRDDINAAVKEMLPKDKSLKLDYKNATNTIMVQVLGRFTGFAIVPEFYELKGYNVRALIDQALGIQPSGPTPPNPSKTEKKKEMEVSDREVEKAPREKKSSAEVPRSNSCRQFNAKGSCSYGATCRWSHGGAPPSANNDNDDHVGQVVLDFMTEEEIALENEKQSSGSAEVGGEEDEDSISIF